MIDKSVFSFSLTDGLYGYVIIGIFMKYLFEMKCFNHIRTSDEIPFSGFHHDDRSLKLNNSPVLFIDKHNLALWAEQYKRVLQGGAN